MGTENDLDVEGQTEPPICGLTRPASASSSHPPSASPTLAGTVVTDDSTVPAFDPETAHTLPVSAVGILLNTDVSFVLPTTSPFVPQLTGVAMAWTLPKSPAASSTMAPTRSRAPRAYPFGRSS